MRYLIVGGVAAGTKVAAKVKRCDRSAEVVVVTKGEDISYAGCGLPYYIGGDIQARDELIVNTPAAYAALTGAEVLVENKLFATLDPTARKLPLPSGLQIILVDTVGFVSRLPHHLVEAFKSTLEEAAYADVIVKVADAGDDQAAEQLAVTDEVLSSLDCEGIPQLVVYNKCDTANLLSFDPDILLTSAKTGVGLPALLAKIDDVLAHRVRGIEVLLPYDKLALADILRSRGSVAEEEYREDGVYYRATVKIDDLHRFEPYLV